MIVGKAIAIDGDQIGRASTASSDQCSTVDDLFIEKLKAGDSTAFETLIDRHSGEIFGLLYRLTEDAEEARDLTQETFIRAFRSVKGFRGDSEIKTWLFRIAVNQSRNRFRWWKRRRRDLTISIDLSVRESETPLAESLVDQSISPEDDTLRLERQRALETALRDLPVNHREVVVLCDVQGLSYEQAAVALAINVGTVKSRLSRGRGELRRRLKGY
jgi:RNA polymerase sigma-70 factor, ECF subfamily